jgi:hypothetical protein
VSEPVRLSTGEILDGDLATLVEAERRVDAVLRSLGPQYDDRRKLRERIAELRGPAELPRPRYRTDKQARVSECPRCGARPSDA